MADDRTVSLEILTYCAEEVERQGDGPLEVVYLVTAWLDATEQKHQGEPLTLERIVSWARTIEPDANRYGMRTCAVRVGTRLCPDWQDVPRLLKTFMESMPSEPDKAYLAFEVIHPFRDGNGRTGKLLYNWLCDSLEHPVMPPNFFHCANP